MEMVATVLSIGAAVLLGLAWALNRHEMAEGAHKFSVYLIWGVFLFGAWEVWQEYGHWLNHVPTGIHVGSPGPNGTPVITPEYEPKPETWGRIKHLAREAGFEFVRDIAIALAVFLVVYVIISAVKAQRGGPPADQPA